MWVNVGVWVRYRNKSSDVAVGGKVVAPTKNVCQGRSNVKVLIGVLWEGLRLSWVRWTWSWSVWGRQREGTGLRGRDRRPGGCNMTTTCSRAAPCPWIFDEAWEDCRHATVILSRFGLCRHFPPRLKSTLRGRRFQTI
jgi:hypothetical protein